MKQLIKTKSEKYLKNRIRFNGKYVDALIKAANDHLRYISKSEYRGNTVNELVKNFKKMEADNLKKEAQSFKMAVKTYKALQIKSLDLLKDFRTGHSMGCYGEVIIDDKATFARYANGIDTYAKSCTWKPTYGAYFIRLTKFELMKIENIKGVWTIAYADGTAKWLTGHGSKHSYKVVWTNGYVFGNAHSTISIEDAKEIEQIRLMREINLMKKDSRFIGYDHIRKIACHAGIEAFCNRHGLNIEFGYNLGYLKSLNDRFSKEYLDRV